MATTRALLFVSFCVIGAIAGYRPTTAPASSFTARARIDDLRSGGYNFALEGTIYNDGSSHLFADGTIDTGFGKSKEQRWWIKQADGSVVKYTNSSERGCTYSKTSTREFDWFSWVLDKPNSFFIPAGDKDAEGNPADVWKSKIDRMKPGKTLIVTNQDETVPISFEFDGSKYTFRSFKATPDLDAGIFKVPTNCKAFVFPPLF